MLEGAEGSSFFNIAESVADGRLSSLWTAMPGIIRAFRPNEMTVDVQPATRVLHNLPDGTTEWATLPLLIDCPVVFPHAGACSLTFPIKAGDECLVVFGTNCIDAWWAYSGVQNQPEVRRHDLSDGFCIPGPWSRPKSLTASTSEVQLRSDDGQAKVAINPSSHLVTVETSGDCQIKCANLTIDASTSTTVNSPVITLNGALTQNKGKGSGARAKFENGAETQDDFIAGGISLKTHTHGGVQSGGSSTGGPK